MMNDKPKEISESPCLNADQKRADKYYAVPRYFLVPFLTAYVSRHPCS